MGSPDPVEQASPCCPPSWLRGKDGVACVRRRWAFFLLAAFTLFVISAFTSHFTSAFYLELGGWELDRVPNLRSQFPIPNPQVLNPSSPFLVSDPSLANPDSGHLPVAIAHLRRATAWDDNNAQTIARWSRLIWLRRTIWQPSKP
jgi:hypothetical protein